ncbi:exonuclease 1 isoform X2 [Microplitis demolitor]|uniref:exonuclease 1 isoform X2 n=1 Tax=Microplitis demolitor TaxID=69319 RepID=UPI0004CD78CE|nr:exonuclease 1 isoform X2 [Microplitis demolitor]
MGITGLLPFLDKSSKRGNISQFSGGTAAVDTYCWLHKGVFTCADKLALGEPTDGYVLYCMKFVQMLLANRIKPILVFDGCYLPAKAETELKRRESRETNKRRAAELMKMGRNAEAKAILRRSVDVTHEMALQVIKKCHELNVDCIVAPYEADAQLAYLNTSGIADVVITEDSDLTLFGCKKIFFKMDISGNGVLVEQDRLHLAMNLSPNQFDIDRFRHMCILSGCDYLPSLPGIGLSKACKFVLKNSDPDIHKALGRLSSYLNMKSLSVTPEYRDSFIRALITFKHQLAFCPMQRKQVRLTTPPPEVTPEQLHHAGDEKPSDLAYQLALGNYDPTTLKKMHDYDPDEALKRSRNSWHSGSKITHPSIWSRDFQIPSPKKTPAKKSDKTKWPNTAGKVMVANTEALKFKSSPLKRSFEDMETDLTESDIIKMYGSNKIQKNEEPVDVKVEEEEEKEVEEQKTPPAASPQSKPNPFLKKSTETSPCLLRGSRRRKLRTFIAVEPTVVDESAPVVSKYFNNNLNQTEGTSTSSSAAVKDLIDRGIHFIPETQDEDLPLSQPDSYKENKISVNDNKSEEKQVLSSDQLNQVSSPAKQQSRHQDEDTLHNHKHNLSDNNMDNLATDPVPDDDIECSTITSHVTSLRSSFFKWSNTRGSSSKLNTGDSSPIAVKNSRKLQTNSKSSRTLTTKKTPPSTQHNLLNSYGFEKKKILK